MKHKKIPAPESGAGTIINGSHLGCDPFTFFFFKYLHFVSI